VSRFPARAVVDLGAVRANARTLGDLAPTAQLMAVVKADAYGHGLLPVARAAVEGGATWLGVAQVTEALALRAGGVTARVLTWLYAPGAPLAEAVAADVDLSVAAPWALREVADAARVTGRTARVHLKVDTGLGRNGLPPEELPAVLDEALRLEAEGVLAVVGIWSHLAFADEPGHPTLHRQADLLRAAAADAEARGARFEVRHIAASASTLTDPDLHLDLVRPGLALYGLTPVPQLGGPERFGLVPAMTVEAELANVKRLPAGHGVSYGHHYVTPADTVVGVVPLGYADGVPRHVSGVDGAPGAPLGVGGRRLAIAGRVCMDQVMVDLGPGAAEVAGDRVVLFGTGADGGPTAQDWADAAGTISYEIVTRLGARVPRVYVDGGREVEADGAVRVAEEVR
jgi:alanine racemase